MAKALGCGPTCAELAQIRADVAAISMPLTATIERKTNVPDAWQSSTEMWTLIATTACGAKSPKPAQMTEFAGQLMADVVYKSVTFPYGQDVQQDDKVTIGPDVLYVQAVMSQQSYPTNTEVLACELQGSGIL